MKNELLESLSNISIGEIKLNPNGTSSTNTVITNSYMYSKPELLNAIVTDKAVELIYKRQYMVSYNGVMPNPEIYKDIYNRFDGGVRRVIGNYIPSQSESYQFED